MALHEILTKKRVELGISLDEIVSRSGVPKGTVSKIMSGNTPNPQIESLKAIAYALDLTLDDLDENPKKRIEYSRENYNGLNAEEAKQFAQGVSNEAMRIALLYDSLDEHGQEILNAIASIESGRIELANAARGIQELDRIGAKRLGSFAGLPHYEMGNPSVSSAKYFARAERAELEKEETETKAAYAEERE